jgi:sigma-E factor negative regulatory protein RseC
MRETITHQGVVESVEGEHVRVNILQVSACSSCKARSLCTTSESKEKIIDVYEPGAAEKYRRGDAVNVCGTLSMGKQAVRLAFGIPLVLTAVWMLAAIAWLKLSELMAVGVWVVLLVAYFYTLYIYRDKLAKQFAFWIE